MNNWTIVANKLFSQISSLDGMKQKIIQAMSEKSCLFLDIGPSDQGELGFAYYEWYDGPDSPDCCPGQVYIAHFNESATVSVGDFERFIGNWPWVNHNNGKQSAKTQFIINA